MKIPKTTGWSLGTAGLCVALMAGGWFALVEPERAEAAESRELTVQAVQTNAALKAQIETLREQFADLPTKQAELAAIRLALPEEPALAKLVRDVSDRSTDAGVVLDSVTSGTPVAIVDPDASVAAAAPAEAEPADTPSAEPSAGPSGAAAEPSAVGAPTAAVPTQPVLAALSVTMTTTGDFTGTTLFLKNVQADMPRALLVEGLTLTATPGVEPEDAGDIVTVLTGRIFVFVDPTEVAFPDAVPSPTPSDG